MVFREEKGLKTIKIKESEFVNGVWMHRWRQNAISRSEMLQ
jgi:hypothetical protein